MSKARDLRDAHEEPIVPLALDLPSPTMSKLPGLTGSFRRNQIRASSRGHVTRLFGYFLGRRASNYRLRVVLAIIEREANDET